MNEMTLEALDRAMRSVAMWAPAPPFYLVAPHEVRLGRIAVAYLHGQITRLEYGRLFRHERLLMRNEAAR